MATTMNMSYIGELGEGYNMRVFKRVETIISQILQVVIMVIRTDYGIIVIKVNSTANQNF